MVRFVNFLCVKVQEYNRVGVSWWSVCVFDFSSYIFFFVRVIYMHDRSGE